MLTRTHLETTGSFLFRWRGQAPLVFIPWLAYAVAQGEPLEQAYGDVFGAIYEILSLMLVFGGLLLRAYSVGHAPRGTSGRNTKGQVAEVLNTTGIYSQCRNPLYLANCMTYVGIALYSQSTMLALVMALALALYYERIIMAEENFLEDKFGDPYRDWAASVPAFFPRLHGWTPPAVSFSIRSTLRREYPSWMAAILLVTLIEIGHEIIEGDSMSEDLFAWIAAGVALAGCLALDIIKKKTKILSVEGR